MVVFPAPATPTTSSAPVPTWRCPPLALFAAERTTEAFSHLGHGFSKGLGGDGRGAGAVQVAGETVRDGPLPGQDRGERVDGFERPWDPDCGDDGGVRGGPVDQQAEDSGSQP